MPEVWPEVRRPEHVACCGDYSVEGFLEGKGNRARELFDGFEQLIAACGPYEVAPLRHAWESESLDEVRSAVFLI